MKLLLTLITVSFLGSSCSKKSEPVITTGLQTNQMIKSAGVDRSYNLYIPANYSNAPVVFLFHGHSSNMNELFGLSGEASPYKIWLDIAQQENIILVVPNGLYVSENEKGWNDCRTDAPTNSKANDVQFVRDLLNRIISTYNPDSKRIYINGTSNGGHFCMRLAQEMPDKITAFAAVVTANAVNSQCTVSSIPVSALIMNGTADPVLPYNGGQMASNRGEVLSAAATVSYWLNRNGITTAPEIFTFPDINTTDNCTAERRLFKNGTNNTEVAFYRIIGGGHTEPSKTIRYKPVLINILGAQNADIEMATEVWAFFKNKIK